MKKASVLIFAVLALSFQVANAAAQNSADLIKQGESLIQTSAENNPQGWPRMNIEAQMDDVRDYLSEILRTNPPEPEFSAIVSEINRLEIATGGQH